MFETVFGQRQKTQKYRSVINQQDSIRIDQQVQPKYGIKSKENTILANLISLSRVKIVCRRQRTKRCIKKREFIVKLFRNPKYVETGLR